MSPADPDTRCAYREMLRVARRVTLSEDEAHDLVQDAAPRGFEAALTPLGARFESIQDLVAEALEDVKEIP